MKVKNIIFIIILKIWSNIDVDEFMFKYLLKEKNEIYERFFLNI